MPKRRLAILTVACATAACLTAAGACAAADTQSLYDALTRSGACFARTYDEAHLRVHPDQTVTRFFLGAPGAEWRDTQTDAHYNLAFEVLGNADTYSGVAICEPGGAAAACDIEGDGGSFTIERSGAGLRIRLERMQLEGMQDVSPDLALRDNRVMLLQPAQRSACAPE